MYYDRYSRLGRQCTGLYFSFSVFSSHFFLLYDRGQCRFTIPVDEVEHHDFKAHTVVGHHITNAGNA